LLSRLKAELFEARLDKESLENIRTSTNKGWVLGSERFKEQIEQQVKRRVKPLTHGGDRCSKSFKQKSKLL
jgi:putative transposase